MLRPILALSALTFLGLMLAPFQWIVLRLMPRKSAVIPKFFHHWGLKCLGIKVHVEGAPAPYRPLFVCSNHVSWLDIPVLGSVMPVIFVSRGDVKNWPVFGFLATLQRTIFIDRTKRTATDHAKKAITTHLKKGDAVVLFPEGTTSDGNRVLQFKSSLLGAAEHVADEGVELMVQPVALTYHGFHGLPMGRALRPYMAWYGDMDLTPHLADFLKRGNFDVTVQFLRPIAYQKGQNRKALAAVLQKEIRLAATQKRQGRDHFSNQPLPARDEIIQEGESIS